MPSKMTFAQYVESKKTLREAVGEIPKRTVEYEVKTYCKLSVGETRELREHVPLKPKHKILIDWLYLDPEAPTPLNLRFEGTTHDEEDHTPNWPSERLLKWLMKNTHESKE